MTDPLKVPSSADQEEEKVPDVNPVADRLKRSFALADSQKLNPDTEGRIVEAAARTGLNPNIIRELPEPEQSGKRLPPVLLSRLSPVTAKFLGESVSNAAIAGDDFNSLATIEKWRKVAIDENEKALAAELGRPPVSIGEAYQQGSDVAGLGKAYFEKFYNNSTQYDQYIGEAEARSKNYSERAGQSGWLRYALTSATEMVPLMMSGVERGTKYGLATGLVGAGVGAAASAGPQVVAAPVTVPAAASIGFRVGFGTGMMVDAYQIEAGHAIKELSSLKDLNGDPLDPSIARVVASGVGALNAGLEVFGFHQLSKTLPKSWLTSGFGKAILGRAVADPGVKQALEGVGKRYVAGVASETATEMAQESANIIGTWIATNAGEILKEQTFATADKRIFTAQNLGRVLEAGQKAFAASVTLGAPGASIEVFQDAQRGRQQQAYQNVQKGLNATIQESLTQQRSPELVRQFLQLTGQGGAAYIDSDHAATLPSEMLAKVGITPAQQDLAQATGQDLRIRIEDAHTRLTREEFGTLVPGLKGDPEALVDPKSTERDTERALATFSEAATREKEYTTELRRVQSELATAVEETPVLREQARAQNQTPQEYAAGVTKLWDAFSRRMSLEGRELNETLRKLTVRAFGQDRDGLEQMLDTIRNGDPVAKKAQPILKKLSDYLATQGIDVSKSDNETVRKKLNGFDQQAQLVIPKDQRLDFEAMAKQWGKATGQRKPVGGIAAWAALAQKSDAKDKARGLELQQSGEGKAGSIFLAGEEVAIVTLFDKANLSTVLHESAHLFLEEMRIVMESGVASDSFMQDWNKLSTWLGANLLAETDPKKIRDAQERFARGFEEYLREGKAPDPDLAGVFERFRNWLGKVYQSVLALGPDRVELTDEVRSVFDRMLAGDKEADSAATSLELDGRLDAEFRKLGLSAEDKERVNALLETAKTKTYGQIFRRRTAGRKAMESEWKDEAAKLILSQPVYQAISFVKQSEGLRWAKVNFDYGADTVLALRDRGLMAAKNADGLQPEDVATKFGFATPEELIVALLDTAKSRDEAVRLYVEKKSAEYDAQFSAQEFMLDTKEYGEYLELMGRYLSAAVGNETPIKAQAFRTLAEQQMMNMPMAEAVRTDLHLATLRKTLKQERRALMAGDFRTALIANEQARLAFERARLAKEAKALQEKLIRKGNQAARSDRGTLEEQHHLNLIGLLQRYGLLAGDPKIDMARREPIAKLFSSTDPLQDTSGLFADWLLDDQHVARFQNLTLSEFQQVDRLVKYLNGKGRSLIKDELRSIGQSREQAAAELIKPMEGQKTKPPIKEGSLIAPLARKWREFIASLDQLLFVMRRADNFSNVGSNGTAGPSERLIYQPLARAASERLSLTSQLQVMIKPHIGQLLTSMAKHGKMLQNTGVPVPEIMAKKGYEWTFERIVSMALNMGNDYNKQALLDGYGITDADVAKLVSILSPEDWAAIQGVWDSVDSLWPKIDDVFYRQNFYHQEKVQAKSFKTANGVEMRGGYYPVKFDPTMDGTVGERTEAANLLESTQALFPTPSVKKSFTKGRIGTGGKPLKLSLSVLGEHLDYATQYITHAEVIQDLDRLMVQPFPGKKANPYKAEIERTQGEEVAKLLRPALAHIARPESETLSTIDKWLEKQRALATAYLLGLNLRVAALQITGATTIINDLGAAHYFNGARHVMSSPLEAWKTMTELSPYMANRAKLMDRDIGHSLRQFSPDEKSIKGVTLTGIRSSAFIFIWGADAMVALPAWWGAYNKALKTNGGDSAAAVTFADELIASTNPSARPLDLSSLQRSNKGLHRLFTMFSTFTIKYGNRQRSTWNAWKTGQLSGTDFMRYMVLEAILPPLFMSMGLSVLWGNDVDDEEMKEAGLSLLLYQIQGLPFVRDLAAFGLTTALNATKEKGEKKAYVRSPTESPIFAGVDLAERFGNSFAQFVKDLDDDTKQSKAVWAFADLVSYKVGVPVPKMARNLMESMRQWEEEDGTIFNVLIGPDPGKRE